MAYAINVTERTNLRSEFILISLCNTAADVSLLICNLYWLRISMKSQHCPWLEKTVLNNMNRKRKSKEQGKKEAGVCGFGHVSCAHAAGYGGVVAWY